MGWERLFVGPSLPHGAEQHCGRERWGGTSSAKRRVEGQVSVMAPGDPLAAELPCNSAPAPTPTPGKALDDEVSRQKSESQWSGKDLGLPWMASPPPASPRQLRQFAQFLVAPSRKLESCSASLCPTSTARSRSFRLLTLSSESSPPSECRAHSPCHCSLGGRVWWGKLTSLRDPTPPHPQGTPRAAFCHTHTVFTWAAAGRSAQASQGRGRNPIT